MELEKERLERLVEHGLEGEVSSPMDPPAPYDLSQPLKIPFEDLAPPLRDLVSDHEKFLPRIDAFEKAILEFKKNTYKMTPDVSQSFKAFFEMIDTEMLDHHIKEEKVLFPLLRKYLIERGECSPGRPPRTAIELMENDHLGTMQTASLVFNLIGLGSKIQHPESRNIVLDHAVEQAREMIESLRLHIFKENQVLFPQAQQLFKSE